MLSEHYFGDLEAYDEAHGHPEYFEKTYVTPSSMSIDSLSNRKKFIIVGRKGVGKTTVQMKLAGKLKDDGYVTHIFRFMYDLRSDDYAEISKTQTSISYTSIGNEKNLFLHYDFRDVWERVFLRRIGETLLGAGIENDFTKFVAPQGSKFKNIFEGLTKNLRIKISGELGPLVADFGIETSDSEIELKNFNKIARELLKNSCQETKFYFFIDELVFSKLDARDDEITLRAAMVRDVLRTAWELNQFSVQNGLDFHFICALRPEIRNLINEYDSESGKFLDGKDVELSWLSKDSEQGTLILEVLRSKIEYSRIPPPKYDDFMARNIHFGHKSLDIGEFLLTNTWGRPRDIVRLLVSIAKKSPNAEIIGENEIKAGLDEYSRASAKELIDELGVQFGDKILAALRNGISRQTYDSRDALWEAISTHTVGIEARTLIDEMFSLGVIGGYDSSKGHHFWAHRGDTYLRDHHQIRIHPALWKEFGIA